MLSCVTLCCQRSASRVWSNIARSAGYIEMQGIHVACWRAYASIKLCLCAWMTVLCAVAVGLNIRLPALVVSLTVTGNWRRL